MTTFEMLLQELKESKLIQKHILDYTWLSGENTQVYPFTVWNNNNIVIQLKDNNIGYYSRFLDKIHEKYKDILLYAVFGRSDGSCPSTLEFKVQN